MKLFVLSERAFDDEPDDCGLGSAIGACFDEEQAREIAWQHTLAFWRNNPRPAALASLKFIVMMTG